MSQQSLSQGSSMQSMTGGMYEPESIRLQREVDEFTHRLEHEKSHLSIIEDQIKSIQDHRDCSVTLGVQFDGDGVVPGLYQIWVDFDMEP